MFNHYSEFFARELDLRKLKNTSYSLRAFARDLGVAHQTISGIIKKSHGISVHLAQKIKPLLNLSEIEAKIFVCLVKIEQTKSEEKKLKALEELQVLKSFFSHQTYNQDTFEEINSWEHNAILSLVDLMDFRLDSKYISKKIQISEEVAENAIARLLKLKLIERNSEGLYRRSQQNVSFVTRKASKKFQEYHDQVLDLAKSKIKNVSSDHRENSSLFLSVNESDYKYITEELSLFRKKLLTEVAQRGGDSDRVYCISFQLFPITNDFIQE